MAEGGRGSGRGSSSALHGENHHIELRKTTGDGHEQNRLYDRYL